MSTRSSHPEDAATEAARRCLEIYGADPDKWPADARAAYGDEIARPALAPARAEAETLDAALASARAPEANETLGRRLMESFDSVMKQRRKSAAADIFAALFAFGRVAPAGAAAGLAVLGATVGIMTSSVTSAAPAASDFVEEAFVIAFAEDEEGALWAEE